MSGSYWIILKDRLPGDHQKVHLWLVPLHGNPYMIDWAWEPESTADIYISESRVTHWMPFIEPPKHIFTPSENDKDFCDRCGKNFRNTDFHLTAKEFL